MVDENSLYLPVVANGKYLTWWNKFLRYYNSLPPTQLIEKLADEYGCKYVWLKTGPCLHFESNESKVFFEIKWIL